MQPDARRRVWACWRDAMVAKGSGEGRMGGGGGGGGAGWRAGDRVLSAAAFESLCALLGLGGDKGPVVVYDAVGGTAAARFWWVSRYYGLANVRILDGGWPAYLAAQQPLETGPAPVARAVSTPFHATTAPQWLATADEVHAATLRGDVQVVDTRTRGEYEGSDLRGNKRTGHVPGAVWLPVQKLLHVGSRVDQATLQKLVSDARLDPAKRTIVYCQSGVRAAATAAVLSSIGFQNVANYDGSAFDYLNHTTFPIRTTEP